MDFIDLSQTPRQCFVADDPGCVVRGARPVSAGDIERMREQRIAQMLRDRPRA